MELNQTLQKNIVVHVRAGQGRLLGVESWGKAAVAA